MSHLARFETATIAEDRLATRESLQDRMATAHTRIKAVLEQITEAAWDEIVMPDAADERDVSFAETRAKFMERCVVLQLGWQAGAR